MIKNNGEFANILSHEIKKKRSSSWSFLFSSLLEFTRKEDPMSECLILVIGSIKHCLCTASYSLIKVKTTCKELKDFVVIYLMVTTTFGHVMTFQDLKMHQNAPQHMSDLNFPSALVRSFFTFLHQPCKQVTSFSCVLCVRLSVSFKTNRYNNLAK